MDKCLDLCEAFSSLNVENTKDIFDVAIEACDYLKTCKSNNNKEVHSLSSVITCPMSQSDCIKLGIALENVLKTAIISNKELKDIRPSNTKGKKEMDHLFCDEIKKIIYYAEIKSNLNLDTEKSTMTYKKCLSVAQELKEKFPDYTIKMFLVSGRHYTTKVIPKLLLSKYTDIKDNVVGINEYLKELNVIYEFADEQHYIDMLNKVANKLTSKKE
jgi:hypothetical protein